MKIQIASIWSQVKSSLGSVGRNGTNGERNGKLARVENPTAVRRIWQSDTITEQAGQRRLAYQLHHGLPRGESTRSVLVATPMEGRVAAEAAITLACRMAEELGRPILLMDASDDWEVSRRLGCPSAEGLSDLLADRTRCIEDVELRVSQANVSFLPRGTGQGASDHTMPENPPDLLARAEKRFDFIVIAGGSVLTNRLSLALAPYVGRVLLLVTEHHTHIAHIDEARSTLEFCNAHNVSLVLNEASDRTW